LSSYDELAYLDNIHEDVPYTMYIYEKLNKFSKFGDICSPMETKIQIKTENQP